MLHSEVDPAWGSALADGPLGPLRADGDTVQRTLRADVAAALLARRATADSTGTFPYAAVAGTLRQHDDRWTLDHPRAEGVDLDAWVAGLPLRGATSRIRALLQRLAAAVAAMQAAGIDPIHLHPDNVRVDDADRPFVLDAGLPRPNLPDDTRHASWLAPEVRAGGPLDASATWWAFGRVVDHLLRRLATRRRGKRDPDLAVLALDLLAEDPADRPDAEAVLDRLGASTPRTAVTPPLVGRRDLLEVLDAVLGETITAGRPRAMLLQGPAGIGKTTLLDAWLATHPEVAVLRDRADARDDVPWRGAFGALGALVRGCASEADADRDAAQAVFGAGPRTGSSPPARDAVVRGLRRCLAARAAEAPVVFALDDVHLAETDAANLIADLLGVSAPVLLVATARTDVPRPFVDTLDSVARRGLGPAWRVHEVPPLQPAAARRLLDALGTPPGQLEALLEAAQGIPLALVGLLPATLDPSGDALRARGGAHDDPLRRDVLELVCLAAVPMPLAAVDLAMAADARGAVQGLCAAGLLTLAEDDGDARLEPSHDAVRTHVQATTPPERARRLHGLLVSAIDAGQLPAWHAARALHLRGAGRLPEAADAAEAAGHDAYAALAYDQAARHFRDAAQWAGTDSERARAARIGEALAHAAGGHPTHAATAYDALADAEPERLMWRAAAIEQRFLAGHHAEGWTRVVSELRRLGHHIDRPVPVRLALAVVDALWIGLFGNRMARTRGPDPVVFPALDLLWSAARGLVFVMPLRGVPLVLRAHRLALASGRADVSLRAGSMLVGLLRTLRLPVERLLDRHARALRVLASRARFPHADILLEAYRLPQLVEVGRWQEVVERVPRLEAALATVPDLAWETRMLRTLLLVGWTARGWMHDVRERATAWTRDAEARGDRYARVVYGHSVALCAVLEGDVDTARWWNRYVRSAWSPDAYTVQHAYATIIDGYGDLAEGRPDRAERRLCRDADAFLRFGGGWISQLRVDRALLTARVRLALGQPDEAERPIRSLERERRDGAQAEARLLRALLCFQRGDEPGVIEHARAAAAMFDALGHATSTAASRYLARDLTPTEFSETMNALGITSLDAAQRIYLCGIPYEVTDVAT